jgi:hypothetical protein
VEIPTYEEVHMYEITGLRKSTLRFETITASNPSEVRRIIEEETASFYNLTVRRVRVGR